MNLLRDKDDYMKEKVADALKCGTMSISPLEFSSTSTIASRGREYFRNVVRSAGSRSASVHSASPLREGSLDRQSFGLRSLMVFASTIGGETSGNQTGVVQNSPVEVTTESTNELAPVPANVELPPKAIELDLLDCDAIPALIAGVLRGTNVNEFLERLEVLAYTGTHSRFMYCRFIFSSRNRSDDGNMTIREKNGHQFSLMIQQACSDIKYEHTGLAIQVAYEVFWHSGETRCFR
jgi:hypothetical protein